MMFGSILLLHVVGFGVFILFVVPGNYKGLGIGVAVLAYTLGLRHAFDADHISAIDNTTRKLMNEGKRPLSVGYFFSLGHSTIVVAIGAGIVFAEKAVYGAVSHNSSGLEQFGGVFGTVISASFLYLIASLNIVILVGHRRGVPQDAQGRLRRGAAGAATQQPRLDVPLLRQVDESDHPALADVPGRGGLRHGLRHRHRGRPAGHHRPAGVAGPALVLDHVPAHPFHGWDVPDGHLRWLLHERCLRWAFFNPVRKVYYNLAITGLSVAICFLIGTIEVLGLLPMELHWKGPFWNYMASFDINTAGFIIVGMFIVTWAALC